MASIHPEGEQPRPEIRALAQAIRRDGVTNKVIDSLHEIFKEASPVDLEHLRDVLAKHKMSPEGAWAHTLVEHKLYELGRGLIEGEDASSVSTESSERADEAGVMPVLRMQLKARLTRNHKGFVENLRIHPPATPEAERKSRSIVENEERLLATIDGPLTVVHMRYLLIDVRTDLRDEMKVVNKRLARTERGADAQIEELMQRRRELNNIILRMDSNLEEDSSIESKIPLITKGLQLLRQM